MKLFQKRDQNLNLKGSESSKAFLDCPWSLSLPQSCHSYLRVHHLAHYFVLSLFTHLGLLDGNLLKGRQDLFLYTFSSTVLSK